MRTFTIAAALAALLAQPLVAQAQTPPPSTYDAELALVNEAHGKVQKQKF